MLPICSQDVLEPPQARALVGSVRKLEAHRLIWGREEYHDLSLKHLKMVEQLIERLYYF
jgi:hypothetical protein